MNSYEKISWLLKRFGDKPYEFSLTELAREMAAGKSGVYKLLAVLQREGFVSRNYSTKKYSLGPALYSLGVLYHELKGLSGIAEPVMQRLAGLTEETVSLGVREGDDAILLSRIESPHEIRLFGKVGQKYPCNAGAIGKLLAAYHNPQRLKELLARTTLLQKTPNTIADVAALNHEYAKIRAQGYAISDNENTPGAFGISAPIRDKGGHVCACICVGGPKERFTADKVQAWISLVVDAGREISQRLAGFNR